ncbi:toxin-antitoxin system, antitoxin component, Xre domain protein [Akkermansia sp. KLE1798]|nr:toxin-antitoxin system, antitoxin component, Xre domain protein [Akkermansia sp. KLE1798]
MDRTFIGGLERGERNVSVMTLCDILRGVNSQICNFFSSL